MPNWCANQVEFTNEDAAEVRKLAEAFNAGKLFETFVPLPNNEWDYNWCIENWGTKWEAGGEGFDPVDVNDIGNSITLTFDTAWSPPIAFYAEMEDMGWTINAMYYEPGMAFCGIYSDFEDMGFEIKGDSAWVRENIPQELDQAFSISDSMSDWENENIQDEP